MASEHLLVSFTHKKEGITVLASAIYKMGHMFVANDQITPSSHLPSAVTVREEIITLAKDMRAQFKEQFLPSVSQIGGGLSTDFITLKAQDRHFYDLIVHYMDIGPSLSFKEPPKFKMVCKTILLCKKNGDGDA